MGKTSKLSFNLVGRNKRYGLYVKWRNEDKSRKGVSFEYWLKHYETES